VGDISFSCNSVLWFDGLVHMRRLRRRRGNQLRPKELDLLVRPIGWRSHYLRSGNRADQDPRTAHGSQNEGNFEGHETGARMGWCRRAS
jgi:hypothetical protein